MKKFKRLISLLLVLCMVLSIAPAITIASATEADADLWIDPINGDDANDGTTEQSAFKTIKAAKKKAAELSANGDVVVILKGGTYDATETIEFGEAESGKNGHTITYRAASGETALISGGEKLDGWTLHDAAHNIYVTDIPKGAELTRQFYVNGRPQPVASMELSPMEMDVFSSNGYKSDTVSSANSSQYLTVDLGESKLVSSVTLYGYSETSSATGKAMGFPENFTIQTSSNGNTWTTQVTETGYTAPSALGGVEFSFTSTDARYVKIEATKLGNPSGAQYYLAFAEVQVGFTSKTKTVNLGIAQHVDLDNALTAATNVTLTAGNPYVVNIGSAAAVGAVIMTADAAVGTVDNIQIQTTTDGTTWKTVYDKTGYTWKQSNTFAINPVAATQIRVINSADVAISQLTVHAPAEISGSVTASGIGASELLDNAFDGSFNSGVQTSPAYKGDIVVDLGSVQDVGGIRLYPTYNGSTVAGYMKAARIQVSTDGVTYHTVLELPGIQTPTGGAQILVLPKGYKAQYVKLQPLMLLGDGEYSLQLDELDIVPSTVTGILAENETPNYVTKTVYNRVSTAGANPRLGYYTDVNGSFVAYEKANGEAECIIDGNRSYGYTKKFGYNELVQWGGSKVPSFLLELPAATNIGAIELAIDPDIWSAPLHFDIQVYTNGTWKTVATEDDPQWVDKTKPDAHYVERYEFDEVSATAARILVYNLTKEDGTYPESSIAANPAGYTTDFCLNEFTLYTVDEISYEIEETVESDTVVHDKVALTNDDILEFGYYRGSDLDTFVDHNDGTGYKIFDGDYDTYGATYGQQYQWMPPIGPNIPTLVLNTVKGGKPSTINTIELAVREDGFCAPYDFELQVTTSADKDNWTTIAKCEEQDWTIKNVITFRFPEIEVYKVRLVATLLTPMSDISEDEWRGSTVTYMHINELTLMNVYDPKNPTATDLVSHGEGAGGAIVYDAKGATASSRYSSSYNPNRAVDGFIGNMENAGLSVNSDARYNFSYLKNPEHVEMHSLYLWYHRIQHIVGASQDGTEIYVDDGMGAMSGTPLMPTWLSNDYMFIDVPGEWYIDRHEGKIYYMAEDDMDGVEAYLPVTEQVIDMEYANNITFEGITFSHTTFTFPSENQYLDQQANGYFVNNNWMQVPAGIELSGCKNVIFDGCQIRNMGTAGIRIKSDGVVISDGCKVINSLVCDISYNGIVIGEIVAHHGYRDWQLVKNVTIQNNFVTRIGIDMFDSVGIFAAYTNGAVIDHNEVSYTPYSGISLGWGWSLEEDENTAAVDEVGNNKVTYNYVHDVCKTNYDGGAIYTLGWQEGSEIAYNYIHDSGTNSSKTENAIYLDEGTAYMEVHHNVIDTVAQSWLQIWKSNIHNNTTHDNYYNDRLSTRGFYVSIGNSTKNNTSFSSLSGNATALSIANSAGLTDKSIKSGEDNGFWLRHEIDQDYWTSADYARYITDEKGWYNVRIDGQIGRTYYNSVDKVVTIVMPEGTDLSALSLQYSNESGWNVSPGTGTTQNFTDPVAYTITSAGGGTVKNWLVRVIAGEDVPGIPLPPSDPRPTPAPTPAPTQDPGQTPTPVPTEPETPTVPTQPTEPETPTVPTQPTEPLPEGAVPDAPVVAPGINEISTVRTGKIQKIVSPTRLTTKFGAYTDAELTVFDDGGDGYCVTDGWYGRSGYSERNASHGTVALIMTLDQTTTIGAIEIVGHSETGNDMTNFTIQAYVDGEWVTVKTVESNPFANGKRTVKYTFPVVETTEVRILVNDWENTADSVKLAEVSLFEIVDGKLYNKIDLTGRIIGSDAHESHPADNLFDGDKSTIYLGNTTRIDLTEGGQPTAIDGFALYHHRGNQSQPGTISILVQKTEAGAFESIETFSTNWSNTAPLDSLFVEFDQTYVAYAIKIALNSYAYAHEFELFQYQQGTDPVEPPVDPTEPSVPTQPTDPTEPSEPTQPTEPAVVPPAITKQPAKAYVAAGKTAKFSVEATGTELTYQWQSSSDGETWKNCTSSKATSATFTFTSKASHSSNYYRCVITDSEGNTVYSNAVKLYVVGVVTQPKTQKVAVGEKVKYTVKATGAGKTYQWQSSTDGKTWKNCSSTSAKYATFTFTSKTSHSSNYYRCKITDSKGNVVYTDAVRLYVLGVTTQPETQKVAVGEKVKYTVKATGAGKTYQWQSSTDGKTWKNCSSSSATSATFTFTAKTSHSSNYYRCVIKDNAGNVVYTDAVRLYVLGVTKQPTAKTVESGKTVKFTVTATGASKTYQWQSSSDGGKTWTNCSSSSATKATFTFTGKDKHDGNLYRCQIKDSGGNTVYTSKVELTVK